MAGWSRPRDLQIFNISELGAWIGYPRQSRCGTRIGRDGRAAEGCRRRGRAALQELPAAKCDEPVTSGHGSSPYLRPRAGLISIFPNFYISIVVPLSEGNDNIFHAPLR